MEAGTAQATWAEGGVCTTQDCKVGVGPNETGRLNGAGKAPQVSDTTH